MPRNTIRPRTQTNVTPSARRTAPGLEVVAPLNVRAPHKGAEALLNALGVAADVTSSLYQRAEDERYAAAYAIASLGGQLDQKKLSESLAYQRGAAAALARRRFIEDENELRTRYEQTIPKDALPAEVNKFIDDFLSERYADEKDPVVLREVIPLMQKMRSDLLTLHTEQLRASTQDQVRSSYAIIAKDELDKTGSLDIARLHDAMLPTLGGAETNAVLASIIANEAQARGMPELIDAIPDRWRDGTATFKGSPKFDDYLTGARRAAQNQKEQNERLAEQAANDELRALREQSEAAALVAITQGRDVTQAAADALAQGVLTPEAFRAIMTFQRTYRDDVEGDSPDFGGIARLEVALGEGTATRTDVVEAYNRGQLGFGKTAKAELTRLLEVASKATSASSLEYQTYFDEVRRLYTPRRDVTGGENMADVRRQAAVIRTFRERILSGSSPRAARDFVLEQFPLDGADPVVARSPEQVVKDFAARKASAGQLRASLGATAEERVQRLRQLAESKAITQDERVAALRALLSN